MKYLEIATIILPFLDVLLKCQCSCASCYVEQLWWRNEMDYLIIPNKSKRCKTHPALHAFITIEEAIHAVKAVEKYETCLNYLSSSKRLYRIPSIIFLKFYFMIWCDLRWELREISIYAGNVHISLIPWTVQLIYCCCVNKRFQTLKKCDNEQRKHFHTLSYKFFISPFPYQHTILPHPTPPLA